MDVCVFLRALKTKMTIIRNTHIATSGWVRGNNETGLVLCMYGVIYYIIYTTYYYYYYYYFTTTITTTTITAITIKYCRI